MLKILPKLTVLLIGTVGLNLSFTLEALSAIFFLQDGTPQEITQFEGTASSVDINLDGTVVPSGETSFNLDTSKTNTILFDFSNDSITLDINMLFTSELLENLNQPPGEINVVETATFPPFEIIDSNQKPTATSLISISEATISQPTLPPQTIFFESQGLIAIPTSPYLVVEMDNDISFLFSGGGIIEEGILADIEYQSSRKPIKLAIPEPSSTIGLLGLALLGIASGWKQRKN